MISLISILKRTGGITTMSVFEKASVVFSEGPELVLENNTLTISGQDRRMPAVFKTSSSVDELILWLSRLKEKLPEEIIEKSSRYEEEEDGPSPSRLEIETILTKLGYSCDTETDGQNYFWSINRGTDKYKYVSLKGLSAENNRISISYNSNLVTTRELWNILTGKEYHSGWSFDDPETVSHVTDNGDIIKYTKDENGHFKEEQIFKKNI